MKIINLLIILTLLCGCNSDPTKSSAIKLQELHYLGADEYIVIIHDDKREVTCYQLFQQKSFGDNSAITCLPDFLLEDEKKSTTTPSTGTQL